MKKLLIALILLLTLAIIAWLGATWLVGQKTEEQVRAYIERSNQLTEGSVEQNLVSYEASSFMSATAITKFKTGIPDIDDLLSDANVITTIQHGPVIMGDEGMTFALSRWDSRLDVESLSDEARAMLSDLFGEQNPFHVKTLLDYDQKARYTLTIPALNMQDETDEFSIAGITVTGESSLEEWKGPATLSIAKTYLKTEGLEASIPTVKGDVDITGWIGSQMLGRAEMMAQGVKITSTDLGDISFDAEISSNTDVKDKQLFGTTRLALTQLVEPSNTLKQASLDLNMSGFNTEGIDEITALQNELNNLQQQLMWNMEATESPEGQEKMMEIAGKIQQLSQQFFQTIFDKLLIAQKSQMDMTLNLSGDKGTTQFAADVVYTGSDKPITLDNIMMGDTDTLFKTFALSIDAKAEKSMLDESLKMVLSMFVMQGFVQDNELAYELKGRLTDGQVVLNGKNMTLEDFIEMVNPSEAATEEQAADISLPEDLQKQIEEEGLTPEVMQILEESEDIDPALLQQLKMLSEMQNAGQNLDAITEPDQAPTPAQAPTAPETEETAPTIPTTPTTPVIEEIAPAPTSPAP
ncbi:MAG: DUF945 family protein, partial [bacterium]